MRSIVFAIAALAGCGGDKGEPDLGASRGVARDPLLDVALPAGAARVTGTHYQVDSAALPCGEAATCTAFADLAALDGFKVNREYPFKFVPDPGTAVDGEAAFTPTGVHTGRLIIKFKRGAPQIGGAFKLSVCSADQCKIETAQLAIAVR